MGIICTVKPKIVTSHPAFWHFWYLADWGKKKLYFIPKFFNLANQFHAVFCKVNHPTQQGSTPAPDPKKMSKSGRMIPIDPGSGSAAVKNKILFSLGERVGENLNKYRC